MRTKGTEWSAWWWLRSPGHNPGNASNVNTDGNVNDNDNNNVSSASGGVRPDYPHSQIRVTMWARPCAWTRTQRPGCRNQTNVVAAGRLVAGSHEKAGSFTILGERIPRA
jgi:hypothetical protein